VLGTGLTTVDVIISLRALQSLFPMSAEWESELAADASGRKEFLKLPINQRQSVSI
jgi:hypothetical protein